MNVVRGEEDAITNFKGNLSPGLVCVVFLCGLGEGEGISGDLGVVADGLKEVGSSRDHVRDGGEGGVRVVGVAAMAGQEGGHAGGGIGGVVAGKLGS
jgi:hypothetical protein